MEVAACRTWFNWRTRSMVSLSRGSMHHPATIDRDLHANFQ